MTYNYYDPKQAEFHFVEITKRANQNRQKRLSLKEDEIYIAFLDPQSIQPIPVNISYQIPGQNQYINTHFP